jgi:hypothetical protein
MFKVNYKRKKKGKEIYYLKEHSLY